MTKIIVPDINYEDIVKYSFIGGYKGVSYKEGEKVKLSDAEHCFTMFLYEIDKQLAGNYRNNKFAAGDLVKEESEQARNRLLEICVKGVVNEYIDRYEIQSLIEKGKREGELKLFKKDIGGLTIYGLNYILMLNGFKIDTDLETKEFAEKLMETNGTEKKIPFIFTGEFLDGYELKKGLEEKKLKPAVSYLAIRN